MVSLDALAGAGLGRVVGDGRVTPSGVQHDSRRVAPGDLFAAVPGERVDGAAFAAGAVAAGAVAVLTERELDLGVPLLVVDDVRRALGPIAEKVLGEPTSRLRVVGVTGTNGKTTTAWLVEAIVVAAGGRPALMGTVAMRVSGREQQASFTTPEGDDISRFARASVDASATHLVMEVSSHGLALHRVDGVAFAVAAFTNLTQDHLDFHGTLEAYGAAKARLFHELGPSRAVINVDDPFGASLADRAHVPTLRCSVAGSAEAELHVREAAMDRAGIRARVTTPAGELALESPLLGAHNLENLLVATGIGLALEIDLAVIARALATAKGAPGRLERVDDPRDVAVLVDYAHTPDALARALAALRPVTPGRLFVVFGCGGDRDRTKRPLMGEAAARGADLVVVTSDNPRTEDPSVIVEEILPGARRTGLPELDLGALADAGAGLAIEVDRRAAIGIAIASARRGDTVLVAGKGHEDYQIIGMEKRPFDDREVAREAIARAVGSVS